jgi:AcrR family transcriptional regulator
MPQDPRDREIVRPSHSGGTPARERELRAQGRRTMRRLLEAGRAAFEQRGFHGARVDDVVSLAETSHGTFYLYFSNKEDLFRALARDAMHDIETVAAEFPAVGPDRGGRVALHGWVRRLCETYRAHAPVIRILGQAEVVGEEVWSENIRGLRRLSDAIAEGMRDGGAAHHDADLTALACLVMIEQVNHLAAAGVLMPPGDLVDRLTDITFSAFFASRE